MPKQKEICIKYGAIPCACSNADSMLIAKESIGLLPINGMRRQAHRGESGWTVWCGADIPADEETFFSELPAFNIQRSLAEAYQFLALPPGYRFLIAGAFAKAWFDPGLLNDTLSRPNLDAGNNPFSLRSM